MKLFVESGEKIMPSQFWFDKKFLTIIFLTFLLQSCEGPRDRRKVRMGAGYQASQSGQGVYFGNEQNQTTNSSPNNATTSRTVGSDGLPAEFSHCNTSTQSFTHFHKLIGDFNICLSKETNSKKILFQTKNSINDFR